MNLWAVLGFAQPTTILPHHYSYVLIDRGESIVKSPNWPNFLAILITNISNKRGPQIKV